MPSFTRGHSQIIFGHRKFVITSAQVSVERPHARFLDLDVTSGKVTIAEDGNKQISFTSRTDIARYLSYVLTQLPAEQLNNRSFTINGDVKVRTTLVTWWRYAVSDDDT